MSIKSIFNIWGFLMAGLLLLPAAAVWGQEEPGKTPPTYDYKQQLRPQEDRIKRSEAVGTGKIMKKRIAVSCIGFLNVGLEYKQEKDSETKSRETLALRDCIEPFEGFTEEVVDALMETGKFIVIERKDIKNIMRELLLAKSNIVRKETALQWEKILNAQFLIAGSLTGTKEKGAERLTLRIFDVTTSEVIASIGIKAKGMDRDELVAEAVKRISEKIASTPWRGKITNVQAVEATVSHEKGKDTLSEKLFYINGGANVNIEEGDYFAVYSIEQEIVDPDEGSILGHVKRDTGILKIVAVYDKYCTAQLQEGEAKKGDWVEYHPDFIGFSKE